MIVVKADTVLLVIDVQEAFDDPVWGTRNNAAAESNIGLLLAAWRAAARPVIHVRHRSEEPGGLFFPEAPGFTIKPEAQPLVGEPLLVKTVNSAFIGTDLEDRLHRMDATELVVVGLTTDHCVSTTARMAGNLGFECLVVADATATFERQGPDGRHWSAQDMHDSALASLNDEFAEVVTTAQLLALS
jgi:nicotinamidase-related amidase